MLLKPDLLKRGGCFGRVNTEFEPRRLIPTQKQDSGESDVWGRGDNDAV